MTVFQLGLINDSRWTEVLGVSVRDNGTEAHLPLDIQTLGLSGPDPSVPPLYLTLLLWLLINTLICQEQVIGFKRPSLSQSTARPLSLISTIY